MAGIRVGGTAAIPLPGTLPFSQIEGTTPPTDADQTNVWIVTNGVGVRLTPYTDPACSSPPCGDEMHSPTLSPDGQSVAYCDFDPDSPFGMALWVVAVDGSSTYPLTPYYYNAGGEWANHPFWHPDGDRITMITAEAGSGGYVGGTLGGRIIEVTYPGGVTTDLWTPNVQSPQREEAYRPTYSPDGAFIAFFVNIQPGGGGTLSRQGLWVMDADGSNVTQLDNWSSASSNHGYLQSGPQVAWSHDSDWIAYVDRGFSGGGTWSVKKIHPDGTGGAVVVSGAAGATKHQLGFEAWADDDSFIVYTETTGSTTAAREVWTVTPAGTGATMIVASSDGPWGAQNFQAVYRDTRSNRLNWIRAVSPSNTKINTCKTDGTDLQATYTAAEAVVASGTGFQWV